MSRAFGLSQMLMLVSGESDNSECVVLEYKDPDWNGYTAIACGPTAGNFLLYASTFDTDPETTTSASATTSDSTTTTTDPTTSLTSPVESVSTTNAPQPKEKTPIAPIVGGVVGGTGKTPQM